MRRRIGASSDVYDPDEAEYDAADQTSLAGTMSQRDNPAAHIAAAQDKIARLKATPPGTNYGIDATKEHSGAQHKITGSRNLSVDEGAGARSGVITSVPVSTNWEAISNAFASRTTQDKLQRMQRTEGGTD